MVVFLVQWVDLQCVIVAFPGHTLGFFYLSEDRARGLMNLGKRHLDHQNWENLMQSAILNGLKSR